MLSKRATLLLILIILTISGCGDQGAIDRAEADRIRQETADESAAKRAEQQRTQEDWEDERDFNRLLSFLFWGGLILTFVFGLLCTVAVLVVRWWQASRAIVVYAEQRAALVSRTLNVDRKTLTWPALISDKAIHVIETGGVLLLDAPQDASPQQVASSALVRTTAVGTKGIENIGKKTQDGQSAHAIPELAGAIPLLLRPISSERSQRPKRKGGKDERL